MPCQPKYSTSYIDSFIHNLLGTRGNTITIKYYRCFSSCWLKSAVETNCPPIMLRFGNIFQDTPVIVCAVTIIIVLLQKLSNSNICLSWNQLKNWDKWNKRETAHQTSTENNVRKCITIQKGYKFGACIRYYL